MSPEKERIIAEQIEPILKERISLDDLAAIYTRAAIVFCGGNKSRASHLLQISRGMLWGKIRRHDWIELSGNQSPDTFAAAKVISLNEYKENKI